MLATIPLIALIHTVTHSPLVDGSRGKTYTPSNQLTHVLVQDKVRWSNVDGNNIMVAGSLMFWDVTNSTNAVFKLGDKITFNGIERYITEIFDATTSEGLHHKELMLL